MKGSVIVVEPEGVIPIAVFDGQSEHQPKAQAENTGGEGEQREEQHTAADKIQQEEEKPGKKIQEDPPQTVKRKGEVPILVRLRGAHHTAAQQTALSQKPEAETEGDKPVPGQKTEQQVTQLMEDNLQNKGQSQAKQGSQGHQQHKRPADLRRQLKAIICHDHAPEAAHGKAEEQVHKSEAGRSFVFHRQTPLVKKINMNRQ